MARLRWWVFWLCAGCSPAPLPSVAFEPGAPPGVERITLRLPPPTPSSSALPALGLLCGTRGPSGRRCELLGPGASAAPAPDTSPAKAPAP